MEQNLGNGQNPAGINRCLHCNKPRNNGPLKKYCSRICYWKSKIGKKHDWGDKISSKLAGKPKSKEHVENVRRALIGRKRPDMAGEAHFGWKGEGALYGTLHDWVARHRGRPRKCEHCGGEDKKIYQWANVSGLYLRDLNDWIRLCVSCHRKMDKNTPRASKIYLKKGNFISYKKQAVSHGCHQQ